MVLLRAKCCTSPELAQCLDDRHIWRNFSASSASVALCSDRAYDAEYLWPFCLFRKGPLDFCGCLAELCQPVVQQSYRGKLKATSYDPRGLTYVASVEKPKRAQRVKMQYIFGVAGVQSVIKW